MKYVTYSGETVLTSDRVGSAVVDYARALVADRSSDLVDIPVVVGESESTASLLIGQGSPLMVVGAEDNDVELDDEMAIARLRSRAAALGPHRVLPSVPVEPDEEEMNWDFL